MGRRFATWILAAPRTILVLGLLLTIATAVGVLRIQINNDLKEVIPHDSPVRLGLNRLEELFGSSETLVIAIRNPEGEVFTPRFLRDLRRFTRELKRTRAVARVESLATAERFVRGPDGGLEIEKLLPRAPRSASEAASIREQVLADPDIRTAFLSQDLATTAVYVDPKIQASDAELVASVQRVIDKLLGAYEVHVTGLPVVRKATDDTIRRDMLLLVPVVAVVLLIVLGIALRTVSGVVYTLLLVFLAILPAAGSMGLLGIPLSAQTDTFPILILAIACADAIHILSTYYHKLRQGKAREQAVREVVEELSLPVFLTSATSALGFLSLLGSPIPPIGGLGVVVAVGIMWAWGLSTFVLPATLLVTPAPRHLHETTTSPRMDRFLEGMIASATTHAGRTFGLLVLVLAAIAGLGLPRIEREVSPDRMFPEDHPIRVAAVAIDAAFRNSAPLDILIEADPRDPEVLGRVHRFVEAVRELPEVGSVDSIAGVVARITEKITGQEGIPSDREQVAQALLLYSISGSPDRFQRLVATDMSAFRVTVRLPNLPPDELHAAVARIEAVAQRELGGLRWLAAGQALMFEELSRLVVRSALVSILFSLALVFLVSVVTFRHVLEGVEGMAPLGITIAGIFGFMGLVGIPLTIATALISSIVIGVGVDYGIHVLARWDLLAGLSHRRRVHETIHEVGRPILFNAAAVAAGLAVLGLSEFEPIRQLGILAVISMVTAALAALVIIPTLKTLRAGKEASREA